MYFEEWEAVGLRGRGRERRRGGSRALFGRRQACCRPSRMWLDMLLDGDFAGSPDGMCFLLSIAGLRIVELMRGCEGELRWLQQIFHIYHVRSKHDCFHEKQVHGFCIMLDASRWSYKQAFSGDVLAICALAFVAERTNVAPLERNTFFFNGKFVFPQ